MISLIRATAYVIILSTAVEFLMGIVGASPAAFARPLEIASALPAFLDPGAALLDVIGTVRRTFFAFLFAIIAGFGAGFLTVNVPVFKFESELLIDFLRSIPATALVPIFLVIFGIGDLSKIAVGAFSGGLAIAITVIVAFRGLDKDRSYIANMIDLRGASRFFLYQLPEMSPALFVGLRTAASLCLILVVVGEMFIGSSDGIGRIIMDRRYSDDIPTLYAALVVAGMIGFSFNQLLYLVEIGARRRLGF